MLDKQSSLGSKQKYVLYLVAGLLWLIGIAVFCYFDGLSILSFAALSLILIGCSFYTLKIKWWVNIGIIVIGIYWIYASYVEYIDPIGNAGAREWWLQGVIAILVGIYGLIQGALVRFR
jgi:apolipoprotein N-acyltransferase